MRQTSTYLPLLITAGLAAVLSWQAIGSTHPWTPLPAELVAAGQPTPEQTAKLRAHNRANDTYALMIFGALCMAAGAPLYARGLRWPLQVASILSAVVIGAASGAAMGGIGFYLDDWLPITWDALVRVGVRWIGMLLPTGIASALFVIVCQHAWRKSLSVLMGGVIGSVFAGLAYALVVALLSQTGSSDSVLPLDSTCQLILFSVAPFLIWGTIAHQQVTATLPAETPNSKGLEAV